MDIILETKDLTKTYKAGNNHINAVDHTSICVERGDFVTIVGKSGSGKSTLLHLIGGLDYPTSGEVWIDNECIHCNRKIRSSCSNPMMKNLESQSS